MKWVEKYSTHYEGGLIDIDVSGCGEYVVHGIMDWGNMRKWV